MQKQKQTRLTTQQAWFQGLVFLVFEMNPGYNCEEWIETHRSDISIALLADTFGTTPDHVISVVVSLKDLLSRIDRDCRAAFAEEWLSEELMQHLVEMNRQKAWVAAQKLPKFKKLVSLTRARKQ